MFGKRTKRSARKEQKAQLKAEKLAQKQAKKAAKQAGKGKAKKPKKESPQRVAEKEHVFADVRVFRYMPIMFAIGALLMIFGFGDLFYQSHEYKVAQSRLAMPLKTQLPMFRGQQKGQLTLQNVILSKDGKHMAASINYDSTAHQQLSSFGKRYKLWLVTPMGYPIKGLHVKYGFFGTDGNAVLQISSDKPLKNQAIVAIIVDQAQLVTLDQLADATADTSDTTVDQSITAQLSNADNNTNSDSSSASSSKDKLNNVAMYYVRLNPINARKVNFDWGNNERALVESLFVKQNIAKAKKEVAQNNARLKAAKRTQQEYQDRLKENPQDQTARQGENNLQDAIKNLKLDNDKQNKKLKTLEHAKISKNVLGQQQTSFRVIMTKDMAYFSNKGVSQ